MATKDLTGQRCGRLVAISQSGFDKYGKALWLCRCDCGNEPVVRANNLNTGHTRSCGCLETETKAAFGTKSKRTHLETKTRLYRIWLGMKTRCYNDKDEHWCLYGGRGIRVCEEWRNTYEAFKNWAVQNGYSDALTIDRIDPDGNYEPNNCRWVTNADQQRNKRNNRYYTYKGRTQLIPAWAKEFGVTDSTIRSRIRRGEAPNDVFAMLERRQNHDVA